MKRLPVILLLAIACAAIGWSMHQTESPSSPSAPVAHVFPAGSMLYLESKDFSSMLNAWNASAGKKQWVASASYDVFSQSRLYLRLKDASDQFAKAAGLPPDMNFLTQVAGDRSALAIYDIGKLQFLYITHLPQAKAMESTLWQGRAKFEPRTVGSATFYVRRDPKSQREVAFAVSGDYLLLATREDLLAGALQLMAGAKDRGIEGEPWFTQAAGSAEAPGDLRMVLNLTKIVPDGYFRTYWVQQNITDLSQYSAAVSDLFLSTDNYREERTLIRKTEAESLAAPEALAATAEAMRLLPEDAGSYEATANPKPDACFELLRDKLLAPHLRPSPASENAPQVQLTSGETGSGSDLETRIDQVTAAPASTQEKSALEKLLDKTEFRAMLQAQSTERDSAGVFVRTDSAVVLVAATDWNEGEVRAAVSASVRAGVTASELGVGWRNESGYSQLDGLWPLAVAVRGNYLLLSDDATTLRAMLVNFDRKTNRQPAEFFAGFNHQRERQNFARMVEVVDRPSAQAAEQSTEHEPQFFSGTVASLSGALSEVAAESMVQRGDKNKVRQTVIYQWSH